MNEYLNTLLHYKVISRLKALVYNLNMSWHGTGLPLPGGYGHVQVDIFYLFSLLLLLFEYTLFHYKVISGLRTFESFS